MHRNWVGLFCSAALLAPMAASAGEVRFSPDDGHASSPVWSKDGKWLAFEVVRLGDGNVDLFVSSVNGAIAKDGVKVNLPGGGSAFGGNSTVAMNPTFHPQGIAVFEGSNQGGQYRLYMYQPGGGAASELLNVTQAPGNITFPSISPDGTMVAFVSSQTGNGDIRDWNRSSNKIDQLTADDSTENFPYYSADGKKMLFTRKQAGTEDIFQLDVAGKTAAALVTGGGDQSRPEYLPDGGVIYFSNERDSSKWDIMTVDATGQNKKTLAKDVRLPLRQRPALTPDGQWVAWGSDDPTKNTAVYMAKTDGSKTVTISTNFTACGEPAVTVVNGRTMLAYTYLPSSGADFRHVTIEDVTDKLQ